MGACPLVWARAHTTLLRVPARNRELITEAPDAATDTKLRIWPGEGHHLPLNQPERCRAAVQSWDARDTEADSTAATDRRSRESKENNA